MNRHARTYRKRRRSPIETCTIGDDPEGCSRYGVERGIDQHVAAAVRVKLLLGTAVRQPDPPTRPHGARVRKTREGTKQAALVAMLQRPEGATIAEVVEATGWQPHTVRGALAGALKKRLGLTIVSEKVEGRGRVYRLA